MIPCSHRACPEQAAFWVTPRRAGVEGDATALLSPFGVCRDHLGELMPDGVAECRVTALKDEVPTVDRCCGRGKHAAHAEG